LSSFFEKPLVNPHLEKHVEVVTALMRVSPDWATFLKLFGSNFKRIPKPGQNDLFDGLE
jgi:hypothetical protein